MSKPFDERINLIFLGDLGVGKTSLLLRISRQEFVSEIEEIDQEQRDVIVDDVTCRVLMTDTAGQERFRTLTSSFYRNAKAIVFVYDITDRESFVNIEGHHADSTRYAKQSQNYLFANKQDLGKNAVVSREEGKELASKLGLSFHETSAVSGEGIDDALQQTVTNFLSRLGEEELASVPENQKQGGAWKSIKRLFSRKK